MSKLLEQTRNILRVRHYSFRIEQVYLDWIIKYIRFHGIRHPTEMGAEQIEAFLTHLLQDGCGIRRI